MLYTPVNGAAVLELYDQCINKVLLSLLSWVEPRWSSMDNHRQSLFDVVLPHLSRPSSSSLSVYCDLQKLIRNVVSGD